MPSFDPAVTSAATRVLLLPAVWRWIRRRWYRLCSRCALRKFRSLAPRVAGLLEQVNEGTVNRDAREALAVELDALAVFPPAIRGERGEAQLEPELQHLRSCMDAREDYLSLPLARKSFSTGRPLRHDADFRKDAIGEIWEQHVEKK